jgi:formate hydrogenlyase transcriptional activator
MPDPNAVTPDRNERDEPASVQLRFEMLITEISARFLSMIPQNVDAEIDRALRDILEFFGSDMCGFFRVSSAEKRAVLSHVQVTNDIPVMPEKFDYWPVAPWISAKSSRGETVLVNSLDELPEEAQLDRRTNEALGVQAILIIPVTSDGLTQYALELAFTRPGPPSLAQYVPRLKVFAGVLVTALERSHAIVALQEAEARLDLAAGLAGAGLWDLDLHTNTFWATPWARELHGFGPNETVDLKKLLTLVHEDDAAQLKLDLERALIDGTTLRTEYRIVLAGGEVRWIAAQGARSPESFGGGDHFLGASIDVTGRKKLEEGARRSHEEIRRLNELLEVETRYLRKEIGLSFSHKEIAGRSDAIKAVMRLVEQVGPTESTVLVLGETGTGKELVARAIHAMSGRNERLMVKVDCASLPPTLIESELFGRERGAYTGALTRQIGRFQLADRGTIFLDEIGELSRETQAKLLRVLQEGAFEILGSPKTVKVDVRIIAATNRNLAREVREGRFREDLYYRLKVFPIEIPPLRDRKEDIPLLVWSFVEKFSAEMKKEVRRIPKETMDALVRYDWPGNVRELKNIIEQAFILSSGDVLTVRLPEPQTSIARPVQALAEMERQHILGVLDQTRWRIKGPDGAASRLALKPSSLYGKMKRLGIPTRRKRDDMGP